MVVVEVFVNVDRDVARGTHRDLAGRRPVQSPLHTNVVFAAGVAVSVTGVPAAKLAAQVAVQLIPPGALSDRARAAVDPHHRQVQRLRILRERRGHEVSAFIVTEHVPVPLHPPPLQS